MKNDFNKFLMISDISLAMVYLIRMNLTIHNIKLNTANTPQNVFSRNNSIINQEISFFYMWEEAHVLIHMSRYIYMYLHTYGYKIYI